MRFLQLCPYYYWGISCYVGIVWAYCTHHNIIPPTEATLIALLKEQDLHIYKLAPTLPPATSLV